MRRFANQVCPVFETQELPKETLARQRRAAAAQARITSGSTNLHASSVPKRAPTKRKKFNLCTYKYHRLADYPTAVRLWGPLDNYTTQTVRP